MEYFEELSIGETHSFGTYEVRQEEIVSFAKQYDPQPFHTDEARARESMFDGLVASGWHTAAMTMRVLVDEFLTDSRALGATGVDELRFRTPVRPGDTLSVETEVVDREPWDDKRGHVHVRVATTNQSGDVVLSMVALVLWERRAES